MTNKKLKMGMIGGGPGSFIGSIHRNAAALDGLIELSAGSFSSNYDKSLALGKELFLPESRIYRSYDEMFERELQLPKEQRIDFVSIITPNHLHFAPTLKALQSGFHVVLDKPMTLDLQEARELYAAIKDSGLLFCLTHTYTGYPMVKQARQLIAQGELGEIRKVYVEYPQGWLWKKFEDKNHKQAEWRTDPAKSGIGGCMGDIGTHAFNLAEYVSGLQVAKLCADLNIHIEGRRLDDDAQIFLKFDNGATGLLAATQIATGAENNLRIRVYGEKAGLDWQQEDANSLIVRYPDKPDQIYRAGSGVSYLSPFAIENTRTPAGHPEGYIEAFANLYRNFARSLTAQQEGSAAKEEWLDFPGAEDGLRGMAFVHYAVENAKADSKWTDFEV